MLAQGTVSALNHLLSGAGWARERLRAFSGQKARVQGGPLRIDLMVDGEGYFRRPDAGSAEAPGVTIELPADTPFRLLNDRNSIFAAARLSGTADFAETLAFVFRNLRWDVEDDLSRVVGDVVAHRLVRVGKGFVGWQGQAAQNLAANVAEYLGEESGLVVPKRDADRFAADLAEAATELERLEERVAKLA